MCINYIHSIMVILEITGNTQLSKIIRKYNYHYKMIEIDKCINNIENDEHVINSGNRNLINIPHIYK